MRAHSASLPVRLGACICMRRLTTSQGAKGVPQPKQRPACGCMVAGWGGALGLLRRRPAAAWPPPLYSTPPLLNPQGDPRLGSGAQAAPFCRPGPVALHRPKAGALSHTHVARVFASAAEPSSAPGGEGARPRPLQVLAPSAEATFVLAALLGSTAAAGDCYCLFGDVGAGKSTFSRAYIRAVAGEDDLTVASPTFMLKLIYDDHSGPPIHHFDLYRLRGPEDFSNLGLKESFAQAVSLVEWPERFGDSIPSTRLDVQIRAVKRGDTLEDQVAPQVEHWERLAEESGLKEDDDLGDEAEDMGESMYEDTAVRVFALQPHGERWEGVVDRLEDALKRDPETLLLFQGLQRLDPPSVS